jgi:ubiquinone/menaquinone biosynthesis C-methylase UbiE
MISAFSQGWEMEVKRIPLAEEPISGQNKVAEYDNYAGIYMFPEYKYFVYKILHQGIRGGRVLDIGTGTGRLAVELARAKNCHFEIIALDISEEMLIRARENARKAGVEDKIKFVLASASFLPFQDESIDLIISYASLHHWLKPASVFKEIQRVTKKTGKVIIRDNRRVYGDKAWELLVRGISLLMSKPRRESWRRVILSSYTIPEIEDLLNKTGFENYQVCTDFVGFDISIKISIQ